MYDIKNKRQLVHFSVQRLFAVFTRALLVVPEIIITA